MDPIRLSNGTTINIEDLPKTRNREVFDVRNGRRVNRSARTVKLQPYKYTIEDRIWQTQVTPEEVAERYNITVKQARSMQYTAKYILEKLDLL